MHAALYGLRGRHPEASELAKRVVLRGDHTLSQGGLSGVVLRWSWVCPLRS